MSAAVQPTNAPAPGTAFDDASVDAYLADAAAWRSATSAALLDLDEQAKLAGLPDATADLGLAFTLWRAGSERLDQVVAARGQGRMSGGERTAVQRLVWTPVADDGGAVLAADLPEVRTLVDALVARIGAALAARGHRVATAAGLLAPVAERVRRASAEAAAVGEMVHQVGALADRLARLGPDTDPAALATEVAAIDAALAPIERDLAEVARGRSAIATDAAAIPGRLAAAEQLEAATRDLAARAADKLADPPRLAVPDVTVLGPPPTLDELGTAGAEGGQGGAGWRAVRATLDAYLARLDRVERALAFANTAFAGALQQRDDLRGLLDGYRAMAAARGLGESSDASAAYDAARAALYRAPCDVAAATELVAAYQRIVTGPEDHRP